MTAYVDLQEREFAAQSQGFTAVKHQREVGTGYFDLVSTAVNPASSTTALAGSTEEQQFHQGLSFGARVLRSVTEQRPERPSPCRLSLSSPDQEKLSTKSGHRP